MGSETAVAKIVKLYEAGTEQDKRAWIESLPPSSSRDIALLGLGMPELEVVGLETAAGSYRFDLPDVCVQLALACYEICAARLRATPTALAFRMGAPRCLSLAANTLRDNGSGADALQLLDAGIAALEEATEVGELLLDRVQILIELGRVAEAEATLEDIDDSAPRHAELAAAVRAAQGDATSTPDPRPFDERVASSRLDQLTSLVDKLGGLVPAEIVAMLRERVAAEAAEPSRSPAEISVLATQAVQTMQSTLGIPTDTESLPSVQKRLREAGSLLVRNASAYELRDAIDQVLAALAIARENRFDAELADALWILTICSKRIGDRAAAISTATELQERLETLRLKLSAEPTKRSGAFEKYPNLSNVLCELLAEESRIPELLDTIEIGKGRVLADVLHEHRREVPRASQLHAAVQEAAKTLGAHYLTFYVDESCIHAVLVTKSGTFHATSIACERETLRHYAHFVDPSTWNKKQGLFGRSPSDFVARWSSLVSWLGRLLESEEIEQGDHICYSADDVLHLFPLHLLHVEDMPIVERVSLSRVHGAAAFVALSKRSPSRPTRFVSIEAPARDDPPAKAAALASVGHWLAATLQGTRLTGEQATLEALREATLGRAILHFGAHGRFPPQTASGVDLNPYTASGLLLAADGELPTRSSDWRALLSPRVLFEQFAPEAFADSHATLLACVSGLAKEGRGSDALGLEWALILRGVASVLSTHWNITAEDGSQFVTEFYTRWLGGDSRAAAWRHTVNQLRAAKPEVSWAAFSLCGDFR